MNKVNSPGFTIMSSADLPDIGTGFSLASCYVGYKVHTELLTLALTARATTVSTLRNVTRLSVHIHLGL